MGRIAEAMTEEVVKRIVEREVELAKQRVFIRIKSLIEDMNRTNMKLKFRNKISPEMLAGEEIKGERNNPLVDDYTANVVDVGAEASTSVRFHPIKEEAAVDSEESDETKIVPETEIEGKQPLLAGNAKRGRFISCKIRPLLFKPRARVIGGDSIKEAKTESFKDFRKKRNNMKLKFRNKISPVILTGEEIKGEGNTPLEVALVDDHTGNTVDVGPEATASVEIILLQGSKRDDDWTVDEFNEDIVPEEEGKKPLLAGNDVTITLQRGIGVVKNIELRHHASKIRPSVFKLGARVVGASAGGDHIKEAKTESFIVKDFRNKYCKKSETPSLFDEVSRLVNIRKGGKIHKRLQDKRINTVEDFLIQLLIDPERLKSIVNLGKKKWKATVKNARACPNESRMYCYINREQRGVVFSVLGEVLGLYLESHYSPTSILSEEHKADARELLASAYENWGRVMLFNDVNSLQQYFTYLSSDIEAMELVEPEYPDDGHEDDETSEIVGESSNRISRLLVHRVSSTKNTIEETGGDDIGWFSTYDNERTVCNPVRFSSRWRLSMSPDVYESTKQKHSFKFALDGLISKSNADGIGAATALTFNQSKAVHPNRWRKLFCVSVWLSIRKMVSVDVPRTRKRPKIV